MQPIGIGLPQDRTALYKWTTTLALITIGYNLIEGLVSIYFGLQDETIALFGFGLDSFVEVVSGMGILHMTRRISRERHDTARDRFESTALRVTGSAFYLLSASLVLTALINLYTRHHPETTFWGIVIATVSIATMWLLIHYKMKVGTALGSNAIIADANCTRACLYLSLVLLASSLAYELTGFGVVDSIGALGIAWFALREGREAFEKSRGGSCACADDGCNS